MRKSAFFLGAALGASLAFAGAANAQLLGGGGGLAGGLTGGLGPSGLSGGLTGSAMGSGSFGNPGLGSRIGDTTSAARDPAASAEHRGVRAAPSAQGPARGAGDTAPTPPPPPQAPARAPG